MNTKPQEIDIKTRDGVAHAWTYRGGEGPRSAVLLYPDAGGVRPAIHEMAERLASLGYFVLLPNIYYRAGAYAPFHMATAWSDPPERARLMELFSSMTAERVGVDSGAYLEAIGRQRDVRKDRIGITGYCIGGRMAFLTAGKHPDKVRAAASFHGGGLATDQADSPHRLADRIRASLYFGVADSDGSCPPEHQGVLAAALGAAGVDYCIELYKGKKHGFAVSDAAAYDQEGAERHWRLLESFFGETLA
jgi:carboxymethylenebutenolidase